MENNNYENQIASVAEKLFLENGFNMTSTTMIAKEVGCNQALIHYYFRTKENLFLYVFSKKWKTFISYFLEVDDSDKPFVDKILEKIDYHFDTLFKNRRLPFLIINEIITNENNRRIVINYIMETVFEDSSYLKLKDQLKEETAKGNIKPISAKNLVLDIISLDVMTFLIYPLYKDINPQEKERDFFDSRKEEIKKNIKSLLEA